MRKRADEPNHLDTIIAQDRTIDELREALERCQTDINWMLNNRQFLNADVFGYISETLERCIKTA